MLSSVSTNALSGIPTLLTPSVPRVSTSRPTTHSQITIPSTLTRSKPLKNILSSPIEEFSSGSWLQGYMNWYSEEIESETVFRLSKCLASASRSSIYKKRLEKFYGRRLESIQHSFIPRSSIVKTPL